MFLFLSSRSSLELKLFDGCYVITWCARLMKYLWLRLCWPGVGSSGCEWTAPRDCLLVLCGRIESSVRLPSEVCREEASFAALCLIV